MTDVLTFPVAAAFIQHSPVPIPPSGDWGKWPILERVWPSVWRGDPRFEGDSLGFLLDNLRRVMISHWAEKIGIEVGSIGDQNLILVFL